MTAVVANGLIGGLAALSAEAAEVAARVRASVVVVRGPGGGQGSGVIWRADGVVLTNDHVVARDRAEVLLADGRQLAATVTRRDPSRDLAALQVPAGDLPAVPVADSLGVRPGELVLAVGNPLGVRGAVSVGIVSGLVRNAWAGRRQWPEMLQADVGLYPGNSGGPLVDAEGRVLGLNSMVLGPGIALAVPSHVAQAFVASDSEPRAYLGVTAQPVRLPLPLNGNLGFRAERGLMVLAVAEGSPAERAGLLLGDVLLAVDGLPVASGEELRHRLARSDSSRPALLSVLRAGQPVELAAALDERQ